MTQHYCNISISISHGHTGLEDYKRLLWAALEIFCTLRTLTKNVRHLYEHRNFEHQVLPSDHWAVCHPSKKGSKRQVLGLRRGQAAKIGGASSQYKQGRFWTTLERSPSLQMQRPRMMEANTSWLLLHCFAGLEWSSRCPAREIKWGPAVIKVWLSCNLLTIPYQRASSSKQICNCSVWHL